MPSIKHIIKNILIKFHLYPEHIRYCDDYRLCDLHTIRNKKEEAWHSQKVASIQDNAYRDLIEKMYKGDIRQDLIAAKKALQLIDNKSFNLLEVGCGSGYYSEIFSFLLDAQIQYTGLDYSKAMLQLAKQKYSDTCFIHGNATALPFNNQSFDVVFNGVSLMHILDYEQAIKESARISRRWCIFHSVPIVENHETMFLTKNAFGKKTYEIIFNKYEFIQSLQKNGLSIQQYFVSIPYNLVSVIGKTIDCLTFACKIDNGTIIHRQSK
jgi:ubiquinone/menaquinone biosynthesis C-methylase UbiE